MAQIDRKMALLPNEIRIAVVQHGDYAQALAMRDSGAGEPYFGMYHSLAALDELLGDHPHLVISLNAPAYRVSRGKGTLFGLPAPANLKLVPKTVGMVVWARNIRRQLIEFAPTHLLLRCSGVLAWRLLRFAKPRQLNCAVIFANALLKPSRIDRLIIPLLIRRLNDPNVHLIGNHKMPATQTLLDAGTDARKTFAYDWPGARRPEACPPRTLALQAGQVPSILYIGNMIFAKGVGDLIDAVGLLHLQGTAIKLVAAGSGVEMAQLQAHAAGMNLPSDRIEFLGQVSNERVFDLMRQSTLICIPSRHSFPEAMPLTLTEAFASRTPVVVSDHPIFQSAFVEGEGVMFFRAANPASLAQRIKSLLGDPERYAMLSQTSATAYARVECNTTLGDLFRRWSQTFNLPVNQPA